MIAEFLKSKAGIIIISIIWGLGISTLFRKACQYGPNCQILEYRGPHNQEASGVWNYGTQKCYKIKPYLVDCATKKHRKKINGIN